MSRVSVDGSAAFSPAVLACEAMRSVTVCSSLVVTTFFHFSEKSAATWSASSVTGAENDMNAWCDDFDWRLSQMLRGFEFLRK